MKQTMVVLILVITILFSGFTFEDNTIPSYDELWSFDITSPCNLTIEELENGLKYELVPYAQFYLDMETKYGINAVFLASKDALESGWGRYYIGNNLSGWG